MELIMLAGEIKKYFPNFVVLGNDEFLSLGFDMRIVPPKYLTFANSFNFLQKANSIENVSVILTTRKILEEFQKVSEVRKTIVLVDNPEVDFFHLHNFLFTNTDFYKNDFKNEFGSNVNISPSAIIANKNVIIGDNVTIEENVVIKENTIIGNDVIIRTGTVIGNEGFQFLHLGDRILKVHHSGGVKIGNRVEIQALCAIDKHIFNNYTSIDEETYFDNFIHFAHGAKIGKRCRCAAKAMIAGSVIIGDDVWIGPSAAISSALTIGNKVSITIGSVVTKDLPDGAHVSGNFAIDHKKFIEHIRKIR